MTCDELTGSEFTDRYTEALHAVIEAKHEDRPPPEAPEPTARPGQPVDLMAALQESVGKAQAARGETDATEVLVKPAKRAPSRRASSRNAGRADGRPGPPVVGAVNRAGPTSGPTAGRRAMPGAGRRDRGGRSPQVPRTAPAATEATHGWVSVTAAGRELFVGRSVASVAWVTAGADEDSD